MMRKIDLNNCNLYVRSRIHYKRQVDEFWEKIQHDVELFRHQKIFFDNPWDMERCSDIFNFCKGIFDKTPNEDPEWVFQLCRFEWLSKFLLLYYKTKDLSLLKEWSEFVTLFFDRNNYKKDGGEKTQKKITLGSRIISRIKSLFFKPNYPTYRTLDTAIRNYTLLINFVHCPDLFESVNRDQILSRIQDDSQYTYDNLRKFDDTSNWGIIIICSYLICNFIINTKREDYKIVYDKLIEMLNKQILPNGAHIESSHMYHNQVLLYLLRLVFWADKCKFVLPNDILTKVSIMAGYSRDFVAPNGNQDLFGDSDNTSLSTLLAVSDVILGKEKKLPLLDTPDFILLNEFDFEYSSYMQSKVVTDSYTKDGITRLSCGDYIVFIYNTKFYSSHKHSDNGSFTLYYKNLPVIIDSGRYTYNDPYWREYFKSRDSHSTIYVESDNLKSDQYSKDITEIVNEISVYNGEIQAHISYKTCDGGTLSRRFILSSKWLEIYDEFIGVSSNIVHQNMILHPAVEPKGTCTCLVAGKYRLSYKTDYEVTQVIQTWTSPHYNEKVKSFKIHMRGILKGNNLKKTKIEING